jgi:hypothetical protein
MIPVIVATALIATGVLLFVVLRRRSEGNRVAKRLADYIHREQALAARDAASRKRGAALENVAAELTDAAYQIALRDAAGRSSVDLEVDLWRVLTDTLKQRRAALVQAVCRGPAQPNGVN